MTKDSMQMQNTYFSAVEGFRQFIRNSVRTKQDHYKWVDLPSKRPMLRCRMSASGWVQCDARAVGTH